MSLIEFAQKELELIETNCKDKDELEGQKLINKNIMQVIKTFSEQGHSGFSANYALNILDKLLRYVPLTPLTGDDDEWTELNYGDDISYQNKRCPSVFKDKNGNAYNCEGKVFSNDEGRSWYTNKDSRVSIEFPYVVPMKPEYVIIDNKKERDKYKSIILNALNQINENFDVNNFDEEKELSEYLTEDRCTELIDILKSKLNVSQLEYPLSVKDKIYFIVTNMLYSVENYTNK